MADDELRRFSRSARTVFARGWRDQFRPSREVEKVVAALNRVLAASVALHDGEKNTHHVAGARGRWLATGRWLRSLHSASSEEPRLCTVEARINDRWTLYVCSRRRLHPDAASLARWAADQLAPYLPRRSADEPTYPPVGGGGGSGGSAEVGIPVWWARKARN